jgi:hypothetical protein
LWKGGVGIGGDYWTIRRATRQLTYMYRNNVMSDEEAFQAARDFSRGNYENPWVKKAIAAEIEDRLYPTLSSYFLAIPARVRTEDEAAVDQAFQEQSEIWDAADTMTPEQWKAAWRDFYTKHPDMSLLNLAREDREYADTAWVWHVLSRLPPSQGSSIMQEYGIKPELLSKWYDAESEDDVPRLNMLSEGERLRLLGAITEIAEVYDIPSPDMNAEWQVAKLAYQQMKNTINRRFPDVVAAEQDYFRIKDRDPDTAKVYLEAHPEIEALWNYRDEYRKNDPILMWFYGKDPRDQAISWLWDAYMNNGDANKKAMREMLGDEFTDNFLPNNPNKMERIDNSTLFSWSMMYGATLYHTAKEFPGEQTMMPKNGIAFSQPAQ